MAAPGLSLSQATGDILSILPTCQNPTMRRLAPFGLVGLLGLGVLGGLLTGVEQAPTVVVISAPPGPPGVVAAFHKVVESTLKAKSFTVYSSSLHSRTDYQAPNRTLTAGKGVGGTVLINGSVAMLGDSSNPKRAHSWLYAPLEPLLSNTFGPVGVTHNLRVLTRLTSVQTAAGGYDVREVVPGRTADPFARKPVLALFQVKLKRGFIVSINEVVVGSLPLGSRRAPALKDLIKVERYGSTTRFTDIGTSAPIILPSFDQLKKATCKNLGNVTILEYPTSCPS